MSQLWSPDMDSYASHRGSEQRLGAQLDQYKVDKLVCCLTLSIYALDHLFQRRVNNERHSQNRFLLESPSNQLESHRAAGEEISII